MPIDPPTDEDRDRLGRALRDRADLVARDGWAPYESAWSTGEVLGVRAVLAEPGAVDAACLVWAPTLWGSAGGELEAKLDYSHTRWWFSAVGRLNSAMIDLTRSTGRPPIDPDDGWATILAELRRDLERIDPDLVVRQVKQKFGILEVWAEASDPALADVVQDRIRQAQEQSAVTCERCGCPGRIQQKPSGWYQALCGVHAADAATEDECEC